MLLVTYRARLSDQYTDLRIMEVGRVRNGVVADYVALERTAVGGTAARVELLGYPRWAEHASGLVARCAHLLWTMSGPGRSAEPPTGPHVESAWIDIGFGSQHYGMRQSLERIEYVRSGFAPRIRVAREHWPAFEYPAPAELVADTGAIVTFLALAAWGATDVPELPSPLDVPVRTEGDGTPVVRLVDIPEPARTAFDRRLQGATVPSPDSAYAWDWTRFVEGA